MNQKVKRASTITTTNEKKLLTDRVDALEKKLNLAIVRIVQLEKMRLPYMENQIGTFKVAK